MASRAFRHRLSSAFSSCPGSTCAGHRPAARTISISMSSPSVRRNIGSSPASSAFRSTTFGASACLRAKASRRCVRSAPRCAAVVIISASTRWRASSRFSSVSSSALPITTVSRLLKSCATPPVSWPIASRRCDWRNRSFSSPMSSRCCCNDCAVWFNTRIRSPSSPLGNGVVMRAARSPAASRLAMPEMRSTGLRMAPSTSIHTPRKTPTASITSRARSCTSRRSARATSICLGTAANTRSQARCWAVRSASA